ncbi:MAG: TIGR04338 family metallohydrolase, partial [Gordonia amarae]
PQAPISVRRRRGGRAAHYEHTTRIIAVHDAGSRFAMRELVVLHELAHALSPDGGHGPGFTSTLVELVRLVIGPQTALALRVLYDTEDVAVG